MKVVSFTRDDEKKRLGLLSNGQILEPLLVANGAAEQAIFANTISFIEAGPVGRRVAKRILESAPQSAWLNLDKVSLNAPLIPSTVLCSGSNYAQHNLEKAGTPISGKEPSHMIWSCAELIHFFSINFTLKPGMVIITGTPAGTAWSTDSELGGKWHPQPGLVAASRYCLPGDVVECEIETIGLLRNEIRAAQTSPAAAERSGSGHLFV